MEFTTKAEANIKQLDKVIAQRILSKIKRLSIEIDFIHPQSLKGQFSDVYKLRVGDYRVLYTLDRDECVMTVHLVKHRRDVYKTIL
ncbi:MAG: type II toxin-antitoxin system RelE/ParE family toxin [Candidatus Schekmanbacteria bacterium]|nr:type II toxin-antitoxin system RelE/ParE family toxin [Candidatus Schekmanbacteria bacterium]